MMNLVILEFVKLNCINSPFPTDSQDPENRFHFPQLCVYNSKRACKSSDTLVETMMVDIATKSWNKQV